MKFLDRDRVTAFGVAHWRWLLPAAVAAFALGLFLKVTAEFYEGEFNELDKWVHDTVIAFRLAKINPQIADLSSLGSGIVLTVFSLFSLLVFLLMGDRRGALALFVGSLGAVFFTVVLKGVVARPRPAVDRLVEVGGHSYPSGHSLGAAAVYFLVALLVMRHFRSWRARLSILGATSLLVGLIGLSRIYLGVHYFSDVASGLLFGTAWAFCVGALFFVWRQRVAR